jgi:pyruvate formate lyase activating enzyme
MGIKGFQGTSLLDFPGRIASLVFWGGCNLTCPFCHNPALVLDPDAYPSLCHEDLVADLAERKSFIDGVVVSGGEPTLGEDLVPFLEAVKALKLSVKLDSNGLAPKVLSNLLSKGLIDYLAIDLKTLPQRYPELHTGPVACEKLLETVSLSREASVELEYRTTCVPGWVDEDVITELGGLIDGAPLWAIQQYHPEHALCEDARTLDAYSPERIQSFADIASRYAKRVIVRGV